MEINWERPKSDLWFIVVHHSVTSENTTVDEIRKMHKAKGYRDIGYHYLVNKEGMHVGRPINLSGAHTLADDDHEQQYYNVHGIGLCLIGNFAEHPPSDKYVNEGAYAIKTLAKKFEIPLDKKHIFGHNNVSQTACPGSQTMAKIYKKLEIK